LAISRRLEEAEANRRNPRQTRSDGTSRRFTFAILVVDGQLDWVDTRVDPYGASMV
jgi:hypothetical protein